jgi:hypothetical protein
MIRFLKRSLEFVAALFLAALLTTIFEIPTYAQSPGDINVSLPSEVAVPGHLLTAGNYEFLRLGADDPSTYEILNAKKEFIGVVHVIPAERPDGGASEFSLSAPDSAGVRLVQAWYGAGDTDGYQLIYSHKDVRKLDRLAQARTQTSGSAAGEP